MYRIALESMVREQAKEIGRLRSEHLERNCALDAAAKVCYEYDKLMALDGEPNRFLSAVVASILELKR